MDSKGLKCVAEATAHPFRSGARCRLGHRAKCRSRRLSRGFLANLLYQAVTHTTVIFDIYCPV